MVSFHDSPEKYNSPKMLKKLDDEVNAMFAAILALVNEIAVYSVTTPTKPATQTKLHTNYPITVEYLNNRICTNFRFKSIYFTLYVYVYDQE